MSWRHLEDVFKTFCKTSWKRLENVLKTSWKRLKDVLKMSCRRFCKRSWRRLEDLLKTSWRCLEDIWSRRIYWSWSRRLEDVFWRRMSKANIFVLVKMPWKRFEDVLKAFSKCLKTSWRCLEDVFARSLEDALKTSWKCLEELLKMDNQEEYIDLDQDVLKTSYKDVWVRQIYSSWSRRLEGVLKTSSEDENKRSLEDVFIKTNVCWDIITFSWNPFDSRSSINNVFVLWHGWLASMPTEIY